LTTIAVAVLADDPVSTEGAVSWLSSCENITAGPWTGHHAADVLLVLAGEIDGETLSGVEEAQRDASSGRTPLVMVAHEIPDTHMLRAVDLGLVSYLHRQESGFEDIKRAIEDAATGQAYRTGLQQALIGHIRAIRDNALQPHGLNIAGLAEREVEVLRFLADGLSTTQTAERLGYSERTVKTVVHHVVTRLNLHNRTHAVAYAVRAGII
jgi:DNA-binding NarL/FixJ family response regulator